jgi:sugar-specific transcriptional regulator TrmB
MKAITNYLESIGLSKTESHLYVTGLKKPSTIDDLIKSTPIKRSTAYHAIKTLQGKGLVSSNRENGRLLFTMTSANNIANYLDHQSNELERKQVELERLRPLFPAPLETKSSNYNVTHFDSIEGLKKVVDVALECVNPEWRVIAPRQNFFSDYDQDYARYYLTKRQAHKIKARTLWETPVDRKSSSSKLTLGDLVSRNPRYLPAKYSGKFKAVIIIFDDKVAYLSSLKNTESLLIQSSEFTSTMQVMFDALWDTSKDILK